MKKLSDTEYRQYWRDVHKNTSADLGAVCFPHKSLYYNKFFDRTQRYALQQFLDSELPDLNGKRVLDVGCGRGRWLKFFQDKYRAVATGVDLSNDAVQICTAQGLNAHQSDITKLPFQNGEFDLVSSITVLLHLPYALKELAVAEIARVLKRGGTTVLLENTWDDPSPHVYSQSVDDWEKQFQRHGIRMFHVSAHCFNFTRMLVPSIHPVLDTIVITMDYPLEYALMKLYVGKRSGRSLQHIMAFRKEGA